MTAALIGLDGQTEALFASYLQPSARPSVESVRAAVEETRRLLDETQCSALVAQEFGDHPEIAAARMLWCCTAVAEAFAPFLA